MAREPKRPHGKPQLQAPRDDDQEIVFLEDLDPRSDVKGGGKLLFGEDVAKKTGPS